MVNELRVLVIADNVLARAGLVALLETQSDYDIVGQTDLSSRIVEDADIFQPDILLIDLGWQVKETLRCIALLTDSDWPVLALLNNEEDASLAISGLAEIDQFGLLLNNTDADLLIQALATVNNGLVVFDPALTSALLANPVIVPDPLIEELTPREDEVLQLLALGMTNKAIAHQLGITDHTVKFHVNAIMTKLDAQSRTDAVVRATRAGLIIL